LLLVLSFKIAGVACWYNKLKKGNNMKIKKYIKFITIEFLHYHLIISWGITKLIRLIDKRKYNGYAIAGHFKFFK
jgi:hypothetical protein